MTKEQLIAAGYTEEQATAILKLHKESIDGNYVTKARFDEVNTAKTSLTTQLKERDDQLKEVGTLTADKATADAKIKELTAANKEAQIKHENELINTRRTLAVKTELLGKVHNPEVVMKMLALDSIEVDDTGKITKGLKEQLTPLQKSDAYLFKVEDNGSGIGAGFKPYTPNGGNGGNTDPTGGANTVAVEYAKSLAKDRAGNQTVQDKAASHYFKNNQ